MIRTLILAFTALVTFGSASPAQPAQVERSQTVFAVLCTDDPARASVRQERLDDHLAFVAANFERYAIAGPLFDASGAMSRSIFMIYAENEAEARALMANDPYVSGGLYAEMEYRRFLPAAGGWIGGVVWAVEDEQP